MKTQTKKPAAKAKPAPEKKKPVALKIDENHYEKLAKISAMSAIIQGHTASGKKLPNPEAVAEHATRYAEELFTDEKEV